jgi:hypothetical protein
MFETRVFSLPKTPIDLIMCRKTITAPSHFEDQINLTDNIDTTTEPFKDHTSQELNGATPLNQVGSKGSPFKTHAHVTN